MSGHCISLNSDKVLSYFKQWTIIDMCARTKPLRQQLLPLLLLLLISPSSLVCSLTRAIVKDLECKLMVHYTIHLSRHTGPFLLGLFLVNRLWVIQPFRRVATDNISE